MGYVTRTLNASRIAIIGAKNLRSWTEVFSMIKEHMGEVDKDIIKSVKKTYLAEYRTEMEARSE